MYCGYSLAWLTQGELAKQFSKSEEEEEKKVLGGMLVL
jgi:hypothetical protein